MASRFNSTIKLYKVDEIQQGHIPGFSSEAKQAAFFENRKVKEIPNCKIVRNGQTVRVNLSSAQVYGVNYISYINPDYGNKTVYLFVMGAPIYINEQTTELVVSEDPLQTWLFDIDVDGNSTVIEREMSSQENAFIASTNPYSESLWEFDTPEHLPVSPELELRQYDFDEYDTDKSTIMDSVAAKLFRSKDADKIKDMLIISPINWDDLDAAWESSEHDPTDVPPSEYWETVILPSASSNNGDNTGNFVVFPNGEIMVDGGIVTNRTLYNNYPTSCYIIVTSAEWRETIIDLLTRYNAISTIVNAFKVPENILYYAFKTTGDEHKCTFSVPDTSSYHNKKLARFPFSYYRIITPALDVKEYKYELCETVRSGGGVFNVSIYTDIINNIKICAAPHEYHYNLNGKDIDPTESITFDQFPTAPLTIDAFLAQMSATAAQTVRQKTISNNMRFSSELNQAEIKTNPVYNALETVGAIGGAVSSSADVFEPADSAGKTAFNIGATVASSAKGLIDTAVAQGKRSADYEILKHQADIIRNATTYLVSGDSGGIFAQEYAATRAGYAADIYMPAKGPGFDHYAEIGWLNLGLIKVTLRDEILERYDKYFDVYGFTSGRIGKPFIVNFLKGSNDTTELPEWRNGETYCKTTECHVIAPYQYVSVAWEAAFKAGIHWINGDEIING